MIISRDSQPAFLIRIWLRLLPLQLIIMTAIIGFVVGVAGAMSVLLINGDFNSAPTAPKVLPAVEYGVHIAPASSSAISPLFTPEVQHWASKIVAWSQQYGIDPNLLATVMQIESCGDPQAGSGAGAQGLFQVMPDHFQATEDTHDPDANARAGIAYLKGSLIAADGHPGLALAGYNGGYGVIPLGWSGWAQETRLYYTWGTGIYMDALRGQNTSASLQDWLSAGGVNLCRQAAQRLAPTTIAPSGPVG